MRPLHTEERCGPGLQPRPLVGVPVCDEWGGAVAVVGAVQSSVLESELSFLQLQIEDRDF